MTNDILTGVLLNEQFLTLVELSHACLVQQTWIISLVEEGVLEPQGQTESCWLFSGGCLQRIQKIKRLELDLGVNIAGAALILELLDENKRLRTLIGETNKK